MTSTSPGYADDDDDDEASNAADKPPGVMDNPEVNEVTRRPPPSRGRCQLMHRCTDSIHLGV